MRFGRNLVYALLEVGLIMSSISEVTFVDNVHPATIVAIQLPLLDEIPTLVYLRGGTNHIVRTGCIFDWVWKLYIPEWMWRREE